MGGVGGGKGIDQRRGGWREGGDGDQRRAVHELVGGVAAAYVIWPFDLIPDFIHILGWLDDLGVVGLVTWYMVRQINKHADARARLPPPPPPPPSLSR